MTFTLLNPHADDFVASPLSFKWANRRALRKYSYLISEAVKQKQDVHILIDGTLSSLIPQDFFNILPAFLRKSILRYEIKKWLELNELTNKVIIHWSTETIKDKSCLYLFSYKNCVGAFDKRLKTIEEFDLKLVNLSHFMIRTAEKGRNSQKLSNAIFTSEADITHTPFFQKHFGSNQKIFTLPFMVKDRFTVSKNLSKRDQRCAATGSFHALQTETPQKYYRDFMNHFKVDTYHPIRKLLFKNQSKINNHIDCKISPYRENGSAWFNRFDFSQKSYFSFNIVDFYNSHPYALIGEEIHGLPAIGAFEAMACGCVLLAEEGDFYKGLGLKAGTHYITHDGTIENICAVIDQLNQNQTQVETISKAGLEYVENNCKAPILYQKTIQMIAKHFNGKSHEVSGA